VVVLWVSKHNLPRNERDIEKIVQHINRTMISKKRPSQKPSAVLDQHKPPAQYRYIPHHPQRSSQHKCPSFVLYPKGHAKLIGKMQELSSPLPDTHKAYALTGNDMAVLEATWSLLHSVEDPTRLDPASLNENVFPLMDKLLKWPAHQMLFPAVDFFRVLLLHPRAASHYVKAAEVFRVILNIATTGETPLRHMALRVVANMFARDSTTRLVLESRKIVMPFVADCSGIENTGVLSTVNGVLLNYATHSMSLDYEGRKEVYNVVVAVLLLTPPSEEERLYQGLLAAFTLVYYDTGVVGPHSGLETVMQNCLQLRLPRISDLLSEFTRILRERVRSS